MIGLIGFGLLEWIQYREARNPFIREAFKTWLVLTPLGLIYVLMKIEQANSLGNFFNKLLIAYGLWVFVLVMVMLFSIITTMTMNMKNGRV